MVRVPRRHDNDKGKVIDCDQKLILLKLKWPLMTKSLIYLTVYNYLNGGSNSQVLKFPVAQIPGVLKFPGCSNSLVAQNHSCSSSLVAQVACGSIPRLLKFPVAQFHWWLKFPVAQVPYCSSSLWLIFTVAQVQGGSIPRLLKFQIAQFPVAQFL